MKRTALTEKHESLGARMAEFAGYYMPISYSGISEEHEAVRKGAGVFDVSHMGEFEVKGPHALELLQKVTTNDVAALDIGQAQYSCMPNHSGGIVDDLLVYKMADQRYMLVVNASNIEKDWNWIKDNNTMGAEMSNISDEIGLLAVQGPKATERLQQFTDVDLSSVEFYHFTEGTFAGIPNTIISATGYTGSGGFELYVPEADLVNLWEAIFGAEGFEPAGLGARDTLRLEMGYCLYGNDITDETSPLEAGLGWITKLKKGDFNSSDIFKKQKEEGLERKLVGLDVIDRRVPRQGYDILNEEDDKIGVVTSGTQSPSLDQPIGLGYVTLPYSKKETEVWISTGRKKFAAKVTRPPFYKPA